MPRIMIDAAVCSDVGQRRERNEDNFFLYNRNISSSPSDRHSLELQSSEDGVYAVFDGMGGQSYGDEASMYAAITLERYTDEILKYGGEAVERYIRDVNDGICNKIRQYDTRLGSTIVLVSICNGKLRAYNIGDSPAYLYRHGRIELLSEEHTVTRQLISAGLLTEEEAKSDKRRHQLTQNLGIFPEELVVQAYESRQYELYPGDCILLCSDGVTDSLTDDDLNRILSISEDAASMAQRIVDEVMNKKGSDNITAMVLNVLSHPDTERDHNHEKSLKRAFGFSFRELLMFFSVSALAGIATRFIAGWFFR